MTSHMLLGSPELRELATIEIEPEMIRASTQFRHVNYRVFSDARARFVVDDARSYFAGAGRRFDLIVSEPSNPWVSGVAGVFSPPFYARSKNYLPPRGGGAPGEDPYAKNESLGVGILPPPAPKFFPFDLY